MTQPSRGRPRSPQVDATVLNAIRALMAEVGYNRVTIEQIAARAGVGKTAIYRRWRTKGQIVLTAIGPNLRMSTPSDTGSLAGDLEAITRDIVGRLTSPGAGWALPGLVSDANDNEELAIQLKEEYIALERAVVGALLDRAVARGELAARPDVNVVYMVLQGAVFNGVFVSRTGVTPGLPGQLARMVSNDLLGKPSSPGRRPPRGRGPKGPGR
ncbi:MAG TPA: TetR/AcrR family transcriptional regulator [Mycobacteriales bacterium]|nr:TetR/AcrR family transcriptional regulator [Mycobacteriales bacterium]